ncbi:hypothetical protein [Helicobacter cetorum]|uniref:Uncharacterized protein n=1 Tax=Helicobacter cetorum (strain ATCC BAA-429 / MIT 00-7128) TaxID=182217 RepID=I0ELM6_HELC0|nr:hypothetical protein [Helicobacter cetorum]AFI03845.1 hypothetical protein HCW_02820 [Helicobacter cetorum MIT 00-7128]
MSNFPPLPNPNMSLSPYEDLNTPNIEKQRDKLLEKLDSILEHNLDFKAQVYASLEGIREILRDFDNISNLSSNIELDKENFLHQREYLNNELNAFNLKMQEYNAYFETFNASMAHKEEELTSALERILRTKERDLQASLNALKENLENALNLNQNNALTSITSAKESALNEIESLNHRISTTLNASLRATKDDFLNQANSKLNTMLEPLNTEINDLKQEQSNLNNNDVLIQNRLDNKLNKFNERQLDLISKNANTIDNLSTKTTSLENRLNDFPTEKIILLKQINKSLNFVNDSNIFKKMIILAGSDSVIFKANKIYLIELFLNYEVLYSGYNDSNAGQLILCVSNNAYSCNEKIIILNNTLRTCKNIDMSGSGNSQYPYVVKTIFRPKENYQSLWLFGREYQSIWINPAYRINVAVNISDILKSNGFYRPQLTNVGEYQYELYNNQFFVGIQSSYLKISELSYMPEF